MASRLTSLLLLLLQPLEPRRNQQMSPAGAGRGGLVHRRACLARAPGSGSRRVRGRTLEWAGWESGARGGCKLKIPTLKMATAAARFRDTQKNSSGVSAQPQLAALLSCLHFFSISTHDSIALNPDN